jgi:hypothetical protein
MQNKKTGLLALAAIVGIGCAFTNKPKEYNGTTYYSITDGNGSFSWTKFLPHVATCIYRPSCYCTIITKNEYLPTNGVIPNNTQAVIFGRGINN